LPPPCCPRATLCRHRPISLPSHPCHPRARKVLGWPKRCKLVHAFMWSYSYI
jgi:hypothetical protein